MKYVPKLGTIEKMEKVSSSLFKFEVTNHGSFLSKIMRRFSES